MIVVDVRSKSDLPKDPEKLRSFSWELALAYQRLSEKYQKLLRQNWGRSSEKLNNAADLDALQLEMDELLDQAAVVEQQSKETEQDTIEIPAHRRRRKHPGRNAIPEDLISEVIIDVPDSEKTCGCGRQKCVIDRKPHVVIERKPAQYTAIRYLRLVYACSCCKDGVSVAEPVVTPIAKGLAGPQLLAWVVLSKYLYHLPLYRIQRLIFHESRIWLTRSTLVTWVRGVCGLLERIHSVLLEEYRSSRIKHADETPFQVKYGEHYREGWMWVGLTGDGRTAAFLYNKHRTGNAALELLNGSREGDFLMIDDCPSYNKPIKQLKLVDLRCMIHIRRKFIEALDSKNQVEYNKKMLLKIGQLYRIERLATKLGLSSERRGELRKKYSVQIMSQIKALLDSPGFVVLPQGSTGSAIIHFRSNWIEATRFLQSGDLPIDNSGNERIIRPFAIGRSNWMQAGSENGAKWMAILYSIITTCKLNDIDPHEYLSDVLMRLAIRPANASAKYLTPVEWYKARNGGKEPKHTPLYPSKH